MRGGNDRACAPTPTGDLLLPIDLPTMPDLRDPDEARGVVNLVHDSIVALPQPVRSLLAGELLGARRSWLLTERANSRHELAADGEGFDSIELLGGRPPELEPIDGHAASGL
jgi:hypothetical protein